MQYCAGVPPPRSMFQTGATPRSIHTPKNSNNPFIKSHSDERIIGACLPRGMQKSAASTRPSPPFGVRRKVFLIKSTISFINHCPCKVFLIKSTISFITDCPGKVVLIKLSISFINPCPGKEFLIK